MDTDWINFRSETISTMNAADLCSLPDVSEEALLETLKSRFNNGDIYSYVGNSLIAVNPYKFFPIYNPKVREHELTEHDVT